MNDTQAVVYLSRSNLTALLSKLDRVKRGEKSHCELIKRDNKHPTMPQTHPFIVVKAVEDEDYYVNRAAGEIFFKDRR